MNNHRCTICHRYHGRSFAVDGILVKDNKILLIKRGTAPHKGYWALPGGHIDFGETAQEACVREFFEETGVKVIVDSMLGLFSSPDRHPYQNITAVFVLKKIGGSVKPGSDAIETLWFPLNKLPESIAFDHWDIMTMYTKKYKSHNMKP